MSKNIIKVFSDGSCNGSLHIGAWAVLIFEGKEQITLSGMATETTHQRMELTAAIKALDYINQKSNVVSLHESFQIELYTDSQYVVDIQKRKEKLKQNLFLTKGNTTVRNVDLLKVLIDYIENMPLQIVKVKAHEKDKGGTTNFNREVDKLARKIVRNEVALL